MYGHPPYNDEAVSWCAMSPVETTLHAAIEAIDEPRSARMDQRTKPSVKASIEAAADLMGIEASAFVVMSAYARAQELLSGRQQTLLSQSDHQALLAALDEETTSTPALLEAWQLHQDQVVLSHLCNRADKASEAQMFPAPARDRGFHVLQVPL
jgi:uncharacterized protein (DUF1778 family)